MSNPRKSIGLLLCSLLVFTSSAFAQQFFKASQESEKFSNQKLQRFSNQDLLVVNSSLESLTTGQEIGELILNRIDNCGNEVWSFSYIYEEGYLEFKDFVINDLDEIFVYGSFYKGLAEWIFMAKFSGIDGSNLDFRLFDPGTVDHFSYTIDWRNDRLMAYGLLFDFNTLKLGFVAVFNEDLTYLWGKRFDPFESSGAAIINRENGFVGWSGEYLFKLDANGELIWAKRVEISAEVRPVSGPFEVADGYILESNIEGISFFYKINKQGQLLWKSDRFPALGDGSALTMLEDGNILCTYNRSDSDYSQISQLILSPEGMISNQRVLIFDNTFATGKINQAISEDGQMAIAGNADPIAVVSVDVKDFLFQFSLEEPDGDCWYWETIDELFPNEVVLNFSDYTFDLDPLDMEQRVRTKVDASMPSINFEERCEAPLGPELLARDTLLPCGEDWEVLLPDADFEWIDGTQENPRWISTPGVYSARKLSCADPLIVDYILSKKNCGCKVFAPNIFSPNFDGINDYFEFFSDCTLDELDLKIFNRWGAQVFQSQHPDDFWDGTFQGQEMSVGVYVAVIRYTFTDLDGSVQEVFLQKDITLVR